MDCNKVVFLGNSHIQGVGSEWPTLYKDLIATPKELRENIWRNYTMTTDDSPIEIQSKFNSLLSKVKYNQKNVQKYRDSACFAALIAKYYKKEYVNYGFDSYNLFQIATKLLLINPTFEDSLVILGVPQLVNDIAYHNPVGTQKFENITIPNIASTIILIKEFVESRGGKFVYFHVENYPEEFYDVKNNPFLYHLNNCKLFDFSLFDLDSARIAKKKIDGVHYDLSGHKFLANKFIEQFENTLIFSILSS